MEDGQYIGMLVRGAGEGFNLIVPMRRMAKWAQDNDLEWALNPELEAPTFDKIEEIPIESSSFKRKSGAGKGSEKKYPFLIKREKSCAGQRRLTLLNFFDPRT